MTFKIQKQRERMEKRYGKLSKASVKYNLNHEMEGCTTYIKKTLNSFVLFTSYYERKKE